jgi:hypothetical protein
MVLFPSKSVQVNIREELIAEIKALHQGREPLNIMAVKRRKPKLIEAVYATTPYWGWKQALADAGIDYKDINVEYDDKVDCRICRQPFVFLANHLIHTHHTTPEDYKEKYNAPLVCEERAAAHMRRVSNKDAPPERLPHWEAPWSAEYVLDRIFEYHRKGVPLNFDAIGKIEQTLTIFAVHYFESWDKALERVGLQPMEIRQKKPDGKDLYPDRDSVLDAIWKRSKKQLPLNPVAVTKQTEKDWLLHDRACQLFSSWDAAVEMAGFEPERKRDPIGYPTKEAVVEELQRRQRMGLTLRLRIVNSVNFEGENPERDHSLVKKACHFFGTWNNALIAAGLPPQIRIRDRKYPTPESVLDELKRRNQTGKSLLLCDLKKEPKYDAALVDSAVKYFSLWKNAIKKAGLYSIFLVQRSGLTRNRRKKTSS